MNLQNDKGLKLTLKTYSKDNNELLGYKIEGEPSKIEELLIQKETYLVRKENDIIQIESHEEIDKKNNEELLVLIKIRKGNNIKLFHPSKKNVNYQNEENVKNLENKMWYIIKYNNKNIQDLNDDYFLKEKDIIRIGNLIYAVHEINFQQDFEDEETEKKDNNDNNDYININKDSEVVFDLAPEIKNNKKCRFCDCYNVSLCNCSNLVHFTCFKKIMNKKVKPPQNTKETVKAFIIEDFSCKNCSFPYPFEFRIVENNSSTYFYVFDIDDINDVDKKSKLNYILLESLGHKNKNGGYKKTVYLIYITEEGVVKIGRNKENDIIIEDPSIKDFHAEIRFDLQNKKIILENKSDKPDIAVLIKNPLKMTNKKIHLQCGRTFFEAKINI